MSVELEAQVIDEAIRWFEEDYEPPDPDDRDKEVSRGRFTNYSYFHSPVGPLGVAGEDVAMTCAIGGIEQAVWRLTGETITRDARENYAHLENESTVEPDGIEPTYARVMGRLNRLASSMYGNEATIEDVTCIGGEGPDDGYEAMMAVLRAAREEMGTA